MSPAFAPLLAGTSAGSLGPADLTAIGIGIVAVDVLELHLAGLSERTADGLRRFIGWDGSILAVARWADDAPAAAGWRARALPKAILDGEELRVVSSIDGRRVRVGLAELRSLADELGSDRLVMPGEGWDIVWTDRDANPPARDVVVSSLAQDQASGGFFWDGAAWGSLDVEGTMPLAPGCECRTCEVARRDYLAHLWGARELTAQHLLTWHNLHQLRRRLEG